jgi:hypothetical protein
MKHLVETTVKAYRNLNNGLWSIKTTKVEGYLPALVLRHVTFHGGHSKAQAKIQAGQARSVHAYAKGTLTGLTDGRFALNPVEVTYRPKERPGFYRVDNGQEVTSAEYAIFTGTKMYCIGARP